MKQKILVINLCFLFAVLASIYAIKSWIATIGPDVNRINNNPDAYMKSVEYVQMDESGKPKMIIQSPQLVHFTKDNTSQFSYPIITLFQASRNQLHITANKGESIHGTQQIMLRNNVVIRQFDESHSALAKLTTSWLTFFPQQNYFTTTAEVSIQQPGISVTAIGLKGDLKTGEVKLLSRTRGIYDPTQYH